MRKVEKLECGKMKIPTNYAVLNLMSYPWITIAWKQFFSHVHVPIPVLFLLSAPQSQSLSCQKTSYIPRLRSFQERREKRGRQLNMADSFDDKAALERKDPEVSTGAITDMPINASGHKQELDRNFSFLSICGLAITSGNVWVALGGSVTVAIYNGGPPGVLYEFIVVSFFYWLVAASIAELASAMPSSGGVYHWASITAGKYGRVCGWFAGWWNFLAWVFAIAATTEIIGAQAVSMYAAFHPAFVTQRWHVFVAYMIVNWLSCFCVLFANWILPLLEQGGAFLIIAGVLITIIVCASMPSVHATNAFVWSEWSNATGYSSNGLVFLLGMLNGAYSVGTPDIVTHLAEEIPR